MDRYQHVVSFVTGTPWAITQEMLCIITDLIAFRAGGGTLTAEEIRERIGAAVRPQPRAVGMVAVLPLYGVLVPRANLMTETSGGTSVEKLQAAFRQMMADPAVSSIVLDVDSPGGAVSGIPELASEIYRARGVKPVYAVADTMAASAAYWLGVQADALYASPSAEVGSIGVLAAHEDISGQMEKEGRRMTLISAGKYKAEGSPYEPLSEEAHGAIAERVSEYYGMFVGAVAKARGVPPETVRSGYGEGRVVGARKAKAEGMIDGIATLDEVVEMAQRKARQMQGARAEVELRQRRLRAVAR